MLNNKVFVIIQITVIMFIISVNAQVFRGYGSNSDSKAESMLDSDMVLTWYYDSGLLELLLPQNDGVIDGIVRRFYDNGMLYSELPYKNGVLDGTAKFFYENGILMFKIRYKNGVETGRMKFYSTSGELRISISRDKKRIHRTDEE